MNSTGLNFEVNETGGKKDVTNKWDPSMIPGSFARALCDHMFKNGPAGKYGRNNWARGMRASQLINAALRHITQLAAGEDIDVESGSHHMTCVAANAMMYATLWLAGSLEDDRAEIYPDAFISKQKQTAKT